MLLESELARIQQSGAELREDFTELIAYRRTNPGDDLLSTFLHVDEDQQSLVAGEILSLIFIIQFGGAGPRRT